ncbi:MAG: alpha/beta hydrolase [Gammaproteobacteria bacterium]|nr:alpha/beta hydrolase [Gammaproteobacteria bacterium]
MASPQAQALIDLYKSWGAAMAANPSMGIEEIREIFDHWGDVTGEPGGVDYLEVDAAGVPCLWAVPKGCAMDRVLVCTHGGGYAVGSMYSHRKMFGHIAKAVGCRAIILNYRRSPEFPHPAQNEDAVAVYKWLLDQGIKPNHIATTGDSAGGALCTSMVLGARSKGLPLPAAIMPQSPWYDMEAKGATLKSNAAVDALVQEPILQGMVSMFLGEQSKQDPLANPLYADLKGLPPIYIQVGGDETLLDDSLRFVEKAKAAGVDVKCDVYPEMQHVFHFLAGKAPEADKAIKQYADWVKPKLGL